jgi:hypothetical protein
MQLHACVCVCVCVKISAQVCASRNKQKGSSDGKQKGNSEAKVRQAEIRAERPVEATFWILFCDNDIAKSVRILRIKVHRIGRKVQAERRTERQIEGQTE